MYFPVQHYLRLTTENALAKLETEPPLHHMVLRSFECAESLLLLAATQTPRLKGKLTHGRPRFALAVLVKLLAIIPERYHTQTYLLEIIGVLLSESSLNKIAQRVHVSDGSRFLPILAAVAYECDMFPEELQDAMDAILAAVYNEIRQACELLVWREAVLKDIHTRNLNAAAPSSSPSSRRSANPFQDTHRLLLENLRRSSTGLSRKDLRKFKCAPYADELSTAGKKRSNPVPAGHKHGNKRVKKGDDDDESKRKKNAQEAFAERRKRRVLNTRRPKNAGFQTQQQNANSGSSGLEVVSGPASTSAQALVNGLQGTTLPAKPRPPPGRRVLQLGSTTVPVPIPKFRRAVYPTTLESEVQRLILAPPDGLRAGHSESYLIVPRPPIPNAIWDSLPIDDIKRCGGLLLIGKYVLRACVTPAVYAYDYQAPLTAELVLSCLLSDCTLRSILEQGDVFHQADTVPAHFPAQAFLVYLAAVFTTKSSSLWEIDEAWIGPIFKPIAHWLSQHGLGDS